MGYVKGQRRAGSIENTNHHVGKSRRSQEWEIRFKDLSAFEVRRPLLHLVNFVALRPARCPRSEWPILPTTIFNYGVKEEKGIAPEPHILKKCRGAVSTSPGHTPDGRSAQARVLSQRPKRGARLGSGAKIAVVVGRVGGTEDGPCLSTS